MFVSESQTAAEKRIRELDEARAEARAQVEQLLARLQHEAHHDLLTGLSSRAKLAEDLNAAIEEASAEGSVVALVQLDLVRFREVNDSLGYTWGDELLVLVGQQLSENSPEGALVARIGGDEFAVAVRVSGASEAAELAATLHEAVFHVVPAGRVDDRRVGDRRGGAGAPPRRRWSDLDASGQLRGVERQARRPAGVDV